MFLHVTFPEKYSKRSQTSKMKYFAKIAKCFQVFIIFAKSSTLGFDWVIRF